ncbi:MAG: EAL domain-containing protein [Pseudomonadota bacterium]
MTLLIHAVLAISYAAAIATAAAWTLRQEAAPIEATLLAAALVFLVCAFLHVLIGGGLGLRTLKRRQAALEGAVRVQAKALENFAASLDGTRAEFDAATQRQSEEVMAEVKILQTLLQQVVEHKPGAKAEAARPPAQASEAAPRHDAEDIFAIMRNALQENRIDLHVQPIVHLPSRRPWHYECFSRVRDEVGRIIFPRDYLEVAVERGLSSTLDNLILFRCVQLIRRLGHRRPGVKFFCNISSASLGDSQFFPQFVDFMSRNRALAPRLVFEFDYADAMGFGPAIWDDLARLARAGFRYSLDNVDSLDFDPIALARHQVAYLKLDAALLLSKEEAGRGELKLSLKRQNIDLIATHIEREETVVEVLDRDIDYAQGYLFGRPRQSPIESMEAEPARGVA